MQVIKNIPQNLKNIYDPPKQLYIIGHPELVSGSHKIIAIVGTRQISDFGKEITSKLTKELVKEGYVIISGMAIGVDGVAHRTALENNGKTIAVLGAGIDIIYPIIHKDLYYEISKNGAIISEHPPGKIVPKSKFAARNRIISGLASAVVIPECSIESGTMVTAKLALDQGKEIFCVPGSAGTDYLISQGANDILHKLDTSSWSEAIGSSKIDSIGLRPPE